MNQFLKSKFFILSIFCFFVFLSCKSKNIQDLQNGDLLFVTAKNSGLSGAINNVTQRSENEKFDHIGILEKKGNSYFVLHAAPKGGSQKQNLIDFVQCQKSDGQNVVVYRLKPEYQNTIPKALKNAETLLGKPYNFNYILNDETLYCSDFIERIFREYSIFKLEPMTFIDPKTGRTNAFWEDFYEKKNLKVPEGELGCNPNGLAVSEKLQRIRVLE